MESNRDKQITEPIIQSNILLLTMVSFVPLIYAMLVFLIQSLMGGENETSNAGNFMDIFGYVIIFISFLIIGVAALKSTEIVRNAKSFSQVFMRSFGILVFLEMPSVLGMTHGIIALLVLNTDVNMPLVMGTSLASIISMLTFTHKVAAPNMKRFVGMKYREEIGPYSMNQ